MSTHQAIPVKAYTLLIKGASALQPLLLLGMRLYWGWHFFLTGKGKLAHLDKVAGFFTELHIPYPKLNAALAGGTECFGGLLLLIGLGSRLVAIPLIFTMCVAYATAERDSLNQIFSDPDKFVTAAPFLFLLCCVVILLFGPGPISVDGLLKRLFFRDKSVAQKTP